MERERVLVVVEPSWLLQGVWAFLCERPEVLNTGLVVLQALLVERTNQGVVLGSLRADEPHFRFSQSRVHIPWEYVKGIVWNDDSDGVKRVIGFECGRQ